MKRLFLLALAPLLAPLLAPAASGATGVKIKEIDALNSPLIIKEDKIVRFTGDVSYTAADCKSAIEVTNCTVVLDIPAGVTVSLGGGNAKGQNGAGAGIRVAPDATLVITGGGTLEVSGGMAADGTSGLDAVKPYTQDDHDAVPGQGGKGGTGGGGAAAAIGGNGGAGSDGGDYTVKEGDYGWSGGSANGTRKGVDGNSGTNGVDGADCGKVYILGRVTVKTKVDTQGGTGGSGGKATNAAVDGKSSRNHAGYGGGGGGGGGGGCGCSDLYKVARCGIGGGAGGGAGGGSGGGGASYQNGKNSGPDREITEKAGFGRGGEGGNGSGKGVDGDFYPAATYKEDVNNSDDGYRTQPVAAYSDGSCDGGAAGKAGLSGNKGADGTLIVGRAVSLSVSNGGNPSLSFNDKNREDFSAVDADVQAMLETSMVVNDSNGTEIATITFYLGEPFADLSDETLAALCSAIPNNADACFDGLMTADGSDLYDAEGRVCREVVGSYEFARTPLKIRLAPKGEGVMVDRGDDKGRRDARSFFGSKGKVAYDSGTHELVIKDGSVTLSGKSVEGRSLKIAVEKGAGKIVFDNLNLSVSNDLTHAIEVHADVTIALKGTNVVSAAKGSGIAVGSSATLTIGRDEGLAHEQAQLWVSTTDGAPAIGTDVNGSSGIVCIKGGQITATGGNTAPAIGSVSGGGMIQINGGLITANATPGSTALGGSGVKFEVSGGSVIARGGVKHNGFMLKGGSVYVSGMLQSVTNADGHVCFGVTLALDGMGDGWAPLMSDCVLKSSKGTPYSLADVRLFPILQDDSLSYARLYLPNGRYEITPKAGCRMLADVKSAATSFTLCGATGLQIGNGTSGMKDLIDLGESDRAAGMVYDAASQVLELGVGNFTLAGAGALDNSLASIQLAKGNVGLTFSDKVITDGTVITGEITDDNATLTLSGGTVFRLGSVEVNALKITGGSIWIETLNAKSVTDGDGKPLFCVTVPDIVGAGENTVAVTAEAGTSFGNYKLDGLYARDEALSLWLPKGGYSFRVNDYLYQADVTTAAVTAERLAFGLTVNGEDLNRVRSDSWSWDVLSETLKLTGENVLSGSSRLGQVKAVVAADARLAFADVTCLSSLAVESGTTVLAGGTSVVTGAVTLAEGAGVAILGGSHNLAFAEDGAESVTDGCGRRVHCVTVDVGGADDRAVAVTGLGEYDVGGIRPVGGRLSLWLCDGYYEFSVDGRDFAAWIRGGATTARLVSGVRVTVGDETMDAAVGGADDKGWTYSPASGELFIFGKGADCALTGRAPQDLRVVQGADTTVRATDLVLAPRSGSPYALREGATNAVLQIGGACAFTAPGGAAGLCVPGDAALTVDRQFNSDPLAPDAVLEVTGGSRAAGIGSGLSGAVGEITIAGATVVARGGEGAAGIGSDFMSPLTAPVARIRITGGTVVAHGGKGAAGIGCGLLGTGADIAISGGFVTAYGGEGAACIGWGASTQDNGSRVMIAISGGTVVCDARLGFAALGYGGDSADARCDITITGGSVNSWLNTASSGVDPRPRDAASNALYRVMLEVNEQEVRLNRRLTLSGLPADYLLSKIVPWRGSEDTPYVVTLYLPAGRYGNVSINGRQYVFTLSGADIPTPVSARLGVTVDGVDGSLSPAGCAYDPVTRTLAITNTTAGGCVVSGGNAYGDVRIEQYPGTTVTLSNAAIAVMSTNGHPCCASPYRIRPGAKATLRLAGGNALTVSRDVDAAGLLVPEGASLVIEDADGSLAVNGHGRGAGIGGDGENELGELEIAGGCVSVDCYGEGAGIGGAGGHVKISGGLVSVWRTEPGGGAGIGTSAETRKARGVEIDITGGIVESRVYGCGGAGIGGGLNAPAACKIRISGGTVFAMGQTGECRIGGAGDFGAGENVPATDFGPGSLVISGGNVRGRYPYCKVDGGATDAEGRPVFCVETETGYAWEEFEGPLAVTVDAPYGTSDIYAQYDNPWVCLWLREGEHSFSVNGYAYEAEVTSFLDEPSPAFVRLVGVSVNGIDCGEGGDPEVTWGWYPKACALELPWGDVTYVICGTNTSGDVQLVATGECARIEVGGILRLGGFGDRPALKGEFTMASGTLVIDGAPDPDAVCHVEGGSVLCDALAGQAFTAGVRPQRLYPIDFVIDGLKDVPMREVAVTGLNREVSGGLGGLVKYDLRNLYAVNGRICLWLTATREGTTYVFEADGVHYRATFANGAFAVVRDPAYITGIRCNGLDIGNGDGEGWEFEDGVLRIFDEGSFTLTGRNDGPVPVRGIVQTSAATVTLDGLSLELPADVTHAPYRLMVEEEVRAESEKVGAGSEDPIGATLLLKGENRLASAGASREITSGKAAVQIDPGVTLVIDRAEPEGVARLEARGAWGGAGIGGAYCAGGFGTIDIRGGEIVAQGGENAAGLGGGGSTSVPDDTTRTNGVIFIRGGVVRATGGAKGAGIGAGLNERIGIGIPIEISGGEIVAQGGENAAGLGGGDYSSAAAVVILGGTVDAHRGPDNGFSLAAPDDVGDGRMILTAETGPLVIRGGNLYCRSLEKDGRADAAMTSVPSNGASRVWRVALDGIAGAVRAHGGDYGSRDVVPVDGRVCLWLPGGTYAFDADETPLDIRVDGETGAYSVTTALTHAVEFPLNGLAVTVTDSLGAVLEPVLATNAQGEAVARLAVRDGVTLTLAFAPPVGSHLTGGATLTVGPVTADRSLSSEIPTHAPDELKFTVRAMSADRVASVDVAVLRNGETVAAASVTNGEGKVGVQYGDRVRLDVHPAPDSVFVGPTEHVVGTNDVAVNVKCLPPVLDYIGWSVTGEVACVASNVAYVTASTVRLEKGGWYAVADGTLALGTLELAGTANLILLDDTDLVVTGSTGRAAVTVARSGRLNVFAARSGGTGRLALAGGAGAAAVSGDLAVYGGTVVAQGGAGTESAVDGEVVRSPKMILRLGESADRAAQSSNEFLLQSYVDFTEGCRLWFAGATMIECTRARTTQYIDHEIVHAGDLVQVWAAKDDVVDFEFAVMASFSEDCELMQDTLRYGPVTASAEITPPLLRPLRNKALTLRFDSHIAGITVTVTPPAGFGDAYTTSLRGTRLEGLGVGDQLTLVPECRTGYRSESQTLTVGFDGASAKFDSFPLPPARYRRWTESGFEDATVAAAPLDSGATAIGGDGWYVVTGKVTTATLKVNGTANLILADGATLTANGGICVIDDNALNVYAQSSDTNRMGKLIATAPQYGAGIGGGSGQTGGKIAIHGGDVTATGGFAAAGIGGGCYGAGGKCVIYDGKVTATGGNEGAGIGGGYQRTGGEITIYGGCVTALASGGSYASGAGIGGGSAYQNEGCPGGTITIYGGTVTATGNSSGAGIGGGYAGSGGVITIFGGRVTATGGWNAAGIGGGKHNIGANGAGTIKINGGTVDAKGQNGGQDIGIGNGGSGGTVTITGGSVLASQSKVNPAPKDAANKPLYRVTVAGFNDGEPVTIDDLENYGLKDIYPIDGNVYLYLPNGSYTFTVDDQTYAATVNDKATEATIVQFVSFLRWNGTELEPDRIASPTVVSGSTTTIGSAAGAWYVVKGEVTTTNLKVSGTAHLILADGATLAATNGVRISEGNALNIYAQSEGAKMGRLVATSGDVDCAVIGGGSGEKGGAISIFGGSVNVTCPPAKCFGACIGGGRGAAGNKVTIRGGEVTVVCSGYGAGIGGGGQQRDDLASIGGSGGTIEISGGVVIVDKAGGGRGAAIGGGGAIGNNATGGSGGTIRISGGRVFVSGRGYGGAGIGGGGAYSYSERGTAEGGGGTIEISGGTVVTEMEDGGLGIGGGFRAMDYSTGLDRYCSAKVTITGGSVLASDVKDDPVDGAKQRLYPVTLTGLSDGERVTITELDGYGTKDIYAAGGQVCLWLPDGTHVFSVNGMDFAVTVNGAVTVATEVSVVPYLRWNGTEMVPDRAYGVSALPDSATTIGSADGSWYVVTGSVTTATLTVNGTANLILADGANLTATGGVRVTEGNTLNIYAQSEGEGMGRLIAKGGKRFAGIGGSAEAAGGTIIIHGGRVAATGGEFAAGIGGGRETAGGTIIIHGGEVAARGFYGAGIGGGQNAPCGTVTINGGRVTASGAVDASSVIGGAGIGGGGQNAAGSITVNGGVVTATGGLRCAGLGCSYRGTGGRVAITGGTVTAVGGGSLDADIGGSDVAVTIDGGCVFGAKALVDPAPKNGEGLAVCLVTLDCPGAEGPVRVEGLKGYGTKDIYPIEGKVYLYLPAGRFTPTINGVTYDVIVFDSDTDRIPVDYIGLNGTTPVSLSAEAALVTENTEWIGTGLIGGAGWYVVTNDVTIFDLKVLGTANLILADGATLTAGGSDGTAIGEGHAGVEVGEGATLRIYAQAGGTGALRAVGSERGAGIGGNGNCSCGTVEIFGGRITAASGGSTGYGAGIGGGCFGDGGTVRIHAGTVIAVGGKGAEDIGGGYCGAGASVTVTGGSVYTSESRIADAPVDGDGNGVWCVTVTPEAGTVAADEPVVIEGPDGYCTFGVFPFAGRLYLYLPNGDHDFGIGEFGYVASVKDAPTEARLAGPTCEDGTLVREGNDYRLVPDEGRSEVTVKGFPASAKLKVPPGVKTVRGVIATAVFVEGVDGFDLSGAFRVFEMLGEELVGTSIRLNPDGEVLVDGEVVSVRPSIGGIFLSDDGFSVSVKTIPGLTYELKRASEPNGAFESVDVAVPATSGHTTLSDAQPPDGKAFYRVNLVWEEE